MQNRIITLISSILELDRHRVESAIKLMDDGCTIPFISRYRKEVTGSMDEVQLFQVEEQYRKLNEFSKRRETVIKSITEQDRMTSELNEKLNNCWSATEIEDIYLPYKPKRRTRAEIARKKGLEPLAKILMAQNGDNIVLSAKKYTNREVINEEEALQGARDIIAEWINESETARNSIRKIYSYNATISSKVVKGKEEEAQKYRDYFQYSQLLTRIPSHRLLAILRAESEELLKVYIEANEEKCLNILDRIFIRANNDCSIQVSIAIKDSYKRLLKPTIDTEFTHLAKERADDEAIAVFVKNINQLLLSPPLGQKRVLGIDPGFRTGCKIVCLDAEGNLLHNENIYPHPPKSEFSSARRALQKMVEAYKIEAIAIGNGTASRETEEFVKNIAFDRKVQIFVVSESGASIYSASKIAREEFPNYDVTVRGAVSIGRRLIDPLAELVKIEPKSIGVGQYQHDVDQVRLKRALDQTVENAVNRVGVNLNTASKHLLTYISGVGAVLAQNIVDYRVANGAFTNRKELLKVPKLGAKTYEQCAAFLRITDGNNPLDNSAVHPESYAIVQQIAKNLNKNIEETVGNSNIKKLVDPTQYISEKVGLPTINDILDELEKPGRDPRQRIKIFEFNANVKRIEDLHEGMELPGIITNITNFGAFCDIGIKENGLIHISNLADKYISNPNEVVYLQQCVTVKVIELDIQRKRIQLKLIAE